MSFCRVYSANVSRPIRTDGTEQGVSVNENSEHDIGELDDKAKEFMELIDGLTSRRERMEELIEQWRRPGWTTPAEFVLTSAALDALTGLARGLHEGISRLEEGVGLVGR
jgi:hypothetical protein